MELTDKLMELLHDYSLPGIQLLQQSFPNNKDFMINVSTLFDPRYVFLVYAPLLFALNKQVGHRMILALTLAEWSNQLLKWLLAGERPYWYAEERANEFARARNESLELRLAALAAEMPASYHEGLSSYLHLTTAPQQQQQQLQGKESSFNFSPPQLKQFPVTCELGAGSPSGHSMVTATVWYILIDAYLRGELNPFQHHNNDNNNNRKQSQLFNGGGKHLFWSVYALMLLLVGLSRVYLACHFPHQCLSGALLGALLARSVVARWPLVYLRKMHYVAGTCFMFASALITYAMLTSLGINPLWSVDKAMKWCANKEYIHLDTTPFFSMMRYLGFCLGSGLAYNATKLLASTQSYHHQQKRLAAPPIKRQPTGAGASLLLATRRLLAGLLAVAFGHILLSLGLPLLGGGRTSQSQFYAISFAAYALFSYLIAHPIPALIKRLAEQSTGASLAATRVPSEQLIKNK